MIAALEEVINLFRQLIVYLRLLNKLVNCFHRLVFVTPTNLGEYQSHPGDDIRVERHTDEHQGDVGKYFIHICGCDVAIADCADSDDGPVAGGDVFLAQGLVLNASCSDPGVLLLELVEHGNYGPGAPNEVEQEHEFDQVADQGAEYW